MINLNTDERKAIEEFDVATLRNAVEEARQTLNTLPLHRLQLCHLCTYVQSKEHQFDRALQDRRKAKSPKNVTRKEQDAIRAGWDLVSALEQMKERARQENADGERFFVEDNIREPFAFRSEMSVTVNYRWRDSKDADWHYGHITFTHRLISSRMHGEFPTKRKKS